MIQRNEAVYARNVKWHCNLIDKFIIALIANYFNDSQYFSGLHGRYIFSLNKNTLDLSANYLWTKVEDKQINVAKDKIHLNVINTQTAQEPKVGLALNLREQQAKR